MRWFVRGDVDGFFGLALDNMVQLLVIEAMCRMLLGFDAELLYGRVLPGVAVSLLIGNLFYAWQAKRLAEREGRTDVCAQPYGINTPSVIAYIFLVMFPVKTAAEASGMSPEAASRLAWHAGLLACLGSGLIEFAGSFVADRIRKITPRAALLSTLAGIAVGFISMTFYFRTFSRPVVGLVTLGIVMLTYFGKVRFKGGLPGGLVAVAIGTALAWMTGIAPPEQSPAAPAFHLPVPVIGDLLEALRHTDLLKDYLSVIIPMGLFNVLGSLQNVESAEAAGDSYPTGPSLAVNGIGTIAAALFGSCFPTTIYIGHPGWKGLGARAGYSILNGGFMTVICLTGAIAHIAWLVPVDAGMAIVLWIGIVISAQAFQTTPRAHAPAVVMGILPGIAAWGALMIKFGLQTGGLGTEERPFTGEILTHMETIFDTFVHGAFALEQGFIFTAMILAASTVYVVERKFQTAAIWCFVGAALCLTGFMHSYEFQQANTVMLIQPAWEWAIGYAVMGACFFAARWTTVEEPGGH